MRNGKSPVTMSAQWHREPVPILCLRQVTFFGFEGVRNMQSQVAELLAQGLAGYPQQTGGLVLVSPRELENARQQDPVGGP